MDAPVPIITTLQPPEESPQVQVITPPEVFPGKWANAAVLARTPHEFTLDFMRVGPGGQQAMVISRINFGPLLLEELIEMLSEHRDQELSESGSRPSGS